MAAELEVSIGAEISGLNAGLRRAGQKIDAFENKLDGFADIGNRLKGVGQALTVGLTVPLAILGVKATRSFAQFSSGMSKVGAVAGATKKELEQLTNVSRDLGDETKFTASQISDLQLDLASAGFNPQQINEATRAITLLSVATGEDLASSGAVAASTLKQFGMSTANTLKIVDLMTASFNMSALNLHKFETAMAFVGPVAKAAGQSIQQTAALLSVLSDAGIRSSTIGTSLRTVFINLANTGGNLKEALKSVKNAQDPLTKATELFGKRAASSVVILANNIDKLNGLTKAYNNAAGSAEKTAKKMRQSFGFQMERLQSAIDGFLLTIGEALAPAVSAVADKIVSLINAFNNLSPSTRKTIVAIGAAVAALGPLLLVVGSIGAAIPALVGGLSTIAGGLSALLGPIGLVVAGIAAIAYAVYKNWDKIKPYIEGAINWFIDLYNQSMVFRAGVTAIAANFRATFSIVVNVLKTAWEVIKSVIKGIADGFAGVGDIISGAFTGNFDKIQQGFRKIGAAQKAMMGSVWNDLKKGWKDLSKDLTGITNDAIRNIQSGKLEHFSFTDKDTKVAAPGLDTKVEKTVTEQVKQGLSNAEIKGILNDFEIEVKGLTGEIKTAVKNVISKVGIDAPNLKTKIEDKINSLLSEVGVEVPGLSKEISGKIVSEVKKGIDGASAGIDGLSVSGIENSIANIFGGFDVSGALDSFNLTGLNDTIQDIVKSVVKRFGLAAPNLRDKIENRIKHLFSNIGVEAPKLASKIANKGIKAVNRGIDSIFNNINLNHVISGFNIKAPGLGQKIKDVFKKVISKVGIDDPNLKAKIKAGIRDLLSYLDVKAPGLAIAVTRAIYGDVIKGFDKAKQQIKSSNLNIALRPGLTNMVKPVNIKAPKLNAPAPINLAIPDEELKRQKGSYEEATKNLNKFKKSILESGVENAIAGVFSAVGTAIAKGGNVFKAVGASLLGSLGSIMIKVGKMAIDIGIGLKAIKAALSSLNPVVAIAAGAALIALGSYFTSKSRSIAQSMGGGGSSGGGGVNGSTNVPSPRRSYSSVSGGSVSGGGKVVFEIEGTSLVGVLKRTMGRNDRIGGNLSLN